MIINRVRDTTTTAGLGAYTIDGTTVTGDRTIAAAVPANVEIDYAVVDASGVWEVNTGTWDGVSSLTRDHFEDSSTGSAINWPTSAQKTVFVGASAAALVFGLMRSMGTTGGTANAQTLSPVPAIQAYRARAHYCALAGVTNTGGAFTLNISTKGARTVKKISPAGLVDPEAGDITIGGYYEWYDDGTRLILLNPTESPPVLGAGILTRVSATQIKFAPKNGTLVRINGALRRIPSAGITAANTSVYVNGVAAQNLAANTAYLVTLFDNSGTLTVDFKSTLTHAPSTTAGNLGTEIWNSDDTRSVIGMIRTDGSSQFNDTSGARLVASWFNRQFKDFVSSNAGGASTTSTSYTNISGITCSSLSWGDSVLVGVTGDAYTTSAGQAAFASVGDGGGTGLFDAGSAAVNVSSNVGTLFAYPASEGYHNWLLLGKSTNGGVGAVFQHSITGGVWA